MNSNLGPYFLGGNVLVTVNSVEVSRALEKKLSRIQGITFEHDTVHVAQIVAINLLSDSLGEESIPSGALLLLVLLALGLTLRASVLTAYRASRERSPRVLRYE
jgi:hypothetical protein